MEHLEAETDSEDELPEGWEERTTVEGRVYYANHKDKSTQWEHPITNKRKNLTGDLPFGWERKILEDGTVVFIDNIHQKTSYTDPRLAFCKSKRKSKMNNPTSQMQYVDVNSTALDLIRDRDLTGLRAIVTGGTNGVGLEVVKALAFTGCHVIIACRDSDRGLEVCENLCKERNDLRLEIMELDLDSLRSVKEFADKYKAKHMTLNLLFLNAATFETEHRLTKDNLESMFQVNYLSQFYLARMLMDTLIQTPGSRIIITGCESHRGGNLSKFDISVNQLNVSRANFSFLQTFCNSKLCSILFANEMNRRLNKMSAGLICKSCHPGNMLPTSLFHKWAPIRCLSLITGKLAKSLSQAAAMPVYVATSSDLSRDCFYYNNMSECSGSPEANDSVLAYRLWEISERLLIERTSEFDDFISNGDQFSSLTKSSAVSSTSTSPEVGIQLETGSLITSN